MTADLELTIGRTGNEDEQEITVTPASDAGRAFVAKVCGDSAAASFQTNNVGWLVDSAKAAGLSYEVEGEIYGAAR